MIEDVRGSQDLIATTGSLDIISHVLEPTLFLRKFCPDFEAAVADFSAVLYSEYGAGSCFHEIDWVEHTLRDAMAQSKAAGWVYGVFERAGLLCDQV